MFTEAGNSISGSIINNDGKMSFGFSPGYGHYFNGNLDDIAVWDDALTSSEITALYNSGTPLAANSNTGNYTSSSNLRGYWRFNENTGSTAYDLSGYGNHGAISGASYSAPDLTAPSVPTGLVATPGSAQNVLTWTANSESDLASYKVYGGTSSSPTTLLSTISAGTETYTHSSLTNGTLYYYRITSVDNNGNESSKTSDVSSLAHDTGGSYSLSFSSTSSDNSAVGNHNVEIPYSSTLDLVGSQAFTYQAWVKVNTDGEKLYFWITGVDGDPENSIAMSGSTSSSEGFRVFWEYGSGSNYVLDENASLTGNVWAHLTTTWDGTTLKMYVNGSLLSSDNATSGPGNTADRSYYISNHGYLDDLGIWNEALTLSLIHI